MGNIKKWRLTGTRMLISETFRDLSENFLQEMAMKTQEFGAFCED